MTRQKAPHRSNCTDSWDGTNLSKLVQHATKNKETKLNYKLAVNISNNKWIIMFGIKICLSWIINRSISILYPLQLCQRICLFKEVAKTCKCLHPLFTDFDALRDPKFATNETSGLEVCNLIAGGTLYDMFIERTSITNEKKYIKSIWKD